MTAKKKKIGFAAMSKAEHARASSRGGQATAKKTRKAKKAK